MKSRHRLILLFLLLNFFSPRASAALVDFEFNQLCNVYWDHSGTIILGSFDKSGLDIEDGGNTSVDVPLDVFCLGRPDNFNQSDAYFRLAVTNVSPGPYIGNDLVLTNERPSTRNAHYQIKANLCAGQAMGGISQLCVSTLNTPTTYVLPEGGDQRELVDNVLSPSSDENNAMNNQLCSAHPSECDYSSLKTGFFNIGKWEHPYRLLAHFIIPQQNGIAPGTYSGTYSIKLDGKLRAETILKIPLMGFNITNVQQPLTFRLSVSSACQISPPVDINFTPQMFSGQSQSQAATAQVRCTYGTPYTVSFKGENDDATGVGYMVSADGKNKIPYQISDTTGEPWSMLGRKFTGTAEKQPIDFQVKTLPGPNKPAGKYEDTITMTVDYTEGT
ncbi:spore coat U domain-containing protein [Rahnella ecdela]|uniref:Spore coat protein U domain-containing protein n=1 Tax=Rahnella ecdela TaxID=2816250 RepID=A0ABS6LDF0_9GAMM|nr:spore coat U domain-containing protein [Rahnella ecdela]MBU9844785.1 spore coat protein U domain-containing protein [Rahnella ecdela]